MLQRGNIANAFLMFVFLCYIVGYTLCNVSFSHTVCYLNLNTLLVGLRQNSAVHC